MAANGSRKRGQAVTGNEASPPGCHPSRVMVTKPIAIIPPRSGLRNRDASSGDSKDKVNRRQTPRHIWR